MPNKRIFAHPELSYISSTDDNGVGEVMEDEEGNKYRWVYNQHSAALTVGQVCFHTFSDGEDAHKYVADGATADLAFMAGVVMATSLTSEYYGWIQIFGYFESVSMYAYQGTAIAAGGSLKGVNGEAYAVLGAAAGTAPLYRRQIIAMEALASDTPTTVAAKGGFIHCI